MASTYTPIATTTLGSAAASYTFSSIPGTYTDLILIASGTVATDGAIRFQFNGDTSTNYSSTLLYGNGTIVNSVRGSNETTGGGGRLGTVVSASILQFMNYSNTTTYKTVISRGGSQNAIVSALVSLWRSSAAITSILLKPESTTNFDAGTTFTLYGIAAA
jgi:hypothetical protein